MNWRCALLAGAAVAVTPLVWYATTAHRQPVASPDPPPSPGASVSVPPSENWAGSRKCAGCHSEIWDSFQTHPMAHSAALVIEAPVVEDYIQQTSFAKPESRIYRVERTLDHVWHHESMTDVDGNVLYDQAVEVHYAIGSGKRGRTYLIDRGGLLKVSPITWYTQGARWDLSPGYPPRMHQRFERRALDECLVCHVGRMSFERDKPNRFGKPPVLEAAIGCERCHGPARTHIEWHESAVAEAGDDPIVNPARLDLAAREDVCNQCHLVGERFLRYGRTDHDFRAGQRLEEVWTVFLKGDGIDPVGMTRAVGQVEQMRESACFRKSQGRLGCISCHDPHSSPTPAEREPFYNGRCAVCHAEKGCSLPPAERSAVPAAGSCIACHMPPLPAGNVPHTSQTDHRVLRQPAAPPSVHAADDSELFDHAELRLPPVDLQRALALRQSRKLLSRPNAAVAARLKLQLQTVLDRYPGDAEVLRNLGSLCMMLHRPEEAREHWLAVLRLRPEHEEALQNMALFEKEQGHIGEAIEYLRRYQAIDSSQADFHLYLAQLLWSAGHRDEAIAAGLEGVALDPRLVPLRSWLARVFRELGRTDEADEQEQILHRMEGR
jgi:hypothetical protein